jgi:hypothetical protein
MAARGRDRGPIVGDYGRVRAPSTRQPNDADWVLFFTTTWLERTMDPTNLFGTCSIVGRAIFPLDNYGHALHRKGQRTLARPAPVPVDLTNAHMRPSRSGANN